jgi:hypothetical protein
MKIHSWLICLVILGVIICQPAVSQTSDFEPVLHWTFQGDVFNGDDMDPVLTTFVQMEDGGFSGTYEMGEEDGLEIGTLSELKWESQYLLKCTWEDKYGSGRLLILFSADYEMFQGFWGIKDDETYYPWNGAAQ